MVTSHHSWTLKSLSNSIKHLHQHSHTCRHKNLIGGVVGLDELSKLAKISHLFQFQWTILLTSNNQKMFQLVGFTVIVQGQNNLIENDDQIIFQFSGCADNEENETHDDDEEHENHDFVDLHQLHNPELVVRILLLEHSIDSKNQTQHFFGLSIHQIQQ